jgi:hypothetical protein
MQKLDNGGVGAELGIRNILVQIRIRGFWLMDLDPDPTPDPTSFFIDF